MFGRRSKIISRVALYLCIFSLIFAPYVQVVHALPKDGNVIAGGAQISTPTATTMSVNQSTDKAIINWQGYGIGANEAVRYLQPGASSIALNRVVGLDPSQIFGLLSANGQVFVINPNGLLVGSGAKIDVGSFLASTMNITNENFLAGNYTWEKIGGTESGYSRRP